MEKEKSVRRPEPIHELKTIEDIVVENTTVENIAVENTAVYKKLKAKFP